MVQWINVLWNNSFVNLTRLPLCEKTRALAIVELGLTAGWLADEMQVNFNLKIHRKSNF